MKTEEREKIKNRAEHYVQNRIIKNWQFNESKNNPKVHYYSLETKTILDIPTDEIFQENFFYDKHYEGMESLIGKIEQPFIRLIDSKKIFEIKNLEINREELIIVKKYIFLQYIRTEKFFKVNMEGDISRWGSLLKDLVGYNDNSNNKYLSQTFDFLYKSNYLAFWKIPHGIEYPLSDVGIIKEPASLLTFWIFPIFPNFAIALLPVEFKSLLESKVFPIAKENEGGFIYARDLRERGYFNKFDLSVANSMCSSNVPILFYTPNDVEYFNNEQTEFATIRNQIISNCRCNFSFEMECTLEKNSIIRLYKTFASLFDKLSIEKKKKRYKFFKDILFLQEILTKLPQNISLEEIEKLKCAFSEAHHKKDIFKYIIYELDIHTASYLSFTIMDESYKGFVFQNLEMLAYPLYFYRLSERQAQLIDFSVLQDKIEKDFPKVMKEIEYLNKMAEEWYKTKDKKH